ncbi:hypothetical protein PHJA_000622500 [Phtheirospermum japonicum]|uniref:Uncharacterized protein n=1 Tax=Phtheirospermum japonicum TaxID=374723 RepID=A0A830BCU8_9LAMI|nr:hypothetical protein PHJA_000622500 [Phtheirospermum japonicum]
MSRTCSPSSRTTGFRFRLCQELHLVPSASPAAAQLRHRRRTRPFPAVVVWRNK